MKKGKKIILFICALRKDDSKMDKAREILEINNQQQLLNYKKINPFILSLILNFSSYAIGEIINRI